MTLSGALEQIRMINKVDLNENQRLIYFVRFKLFRFIRIPLRGRPGFDWTFHEWKFSFFVQKYEAFSLLLNIVKAPCSLWTRSFESVSALN